MSSWFPEPCDWLALAATRIREHAEIMGHGPRVDKDATAAQPTGSRTMPTPQAPPCPVNVIQLDSRRP